MLAVRKTSQAFGRGTRRFLRPGNRKILAYLREYGDDSILCVANLSRSAQPVELDLSEFKGRVPVEMLGRTTFPPDRRSALSADAAGAWLLLVQIDRGCRGARLARTRSCPSTSGPCWCCSTAGAALFRDRVVPWRIGHGGEDARCNSRPKRCRVSSRRSAGTRPRARPSSAPASPTMCSGRRARRAGCSRCSRSRAAARAASYFMPLALAWEEREEERLRNLSTAAIAKVRQQANVGVMGDAFADEVFCRARRGCHGASRARSRLRRASSSSGRPPPSAGLPAERFRRSAGGAGRRARARIPWS